MVGPSSTCFAPASSTPTEQFQLDRKTNSTECNLSASTPQKKHIPAGVYNRSGNETEFRVAISRDGGRTWDNVRVVGANGIRFRVGGLLPNTRYLFKVRAANAGGFSDYSNTTDLTTRRS